MDNNMFQRLKDLITQHTAIGIIIAPNASLDDTAAGLGMYLALKQMGKNVVIASPTDVTVGVSSLVGIDKVQRVLGGAGGDLVVSFPYKEGEIEKVSYTVDNGQLNIVVKAGANGLSFNQSDVQYKQGGAMPTLLFCMGVTDMQSISTVVNPAELGAATIVNIDNKSTNTGFGNVVHVSPKFSSISEMVADFLTLLEPQIELDVDTSQDLLSGILAATNNFQDGRGSYLAFEMAGILMKKGAIRSQNGPIANPTTVPMPSQNYFPPQQPVQPVMQPAYQPVIQSQQFQPAPQATNQPMAEVQPLQQFAPAPAQPMQSEPQVGQPMQQQPTQQPPSDWLTPKVYKGSTAV